MKLYFYVIATIDFLLMVMINFTTDMQGDNLLRFYAHNILFWVLLGTAIILGKIEYKK